MVGCYMVDVSVLLSTPFTTTGATRTHPGRAMVYGHYRSRPTKKSAEHKHKDVMPRPGRFSRNLCAYVDGKNSIRSRFNSMKFSRFNCFLCVFKSVEEAVRIHTELIGKIATGKQ